MFSVVSDCPRCGGFVRKDKDYIFDIEYYICGNCGEVFYNKEDGLGIKRYRLQKKKKLYLLMCDACGKSFESTSPNKPKCPKCKEGSDAT